MLSPQFSRKGQAYDHFLCSSWRSDRRRLLALLSFRGELSFVENEVENTWRRK